MTTKKQDEPEVLYLEAHPKSVKRALKVLGFKLSVDVHASVKENGEHGKTTVTYTHALNAGNHRLALDALTKQANIEEDHLLRADPEEDE